MRFVILAVMAVSMPVTASAYFSLETKDDCLERLSSETYNTEIAEKASDHFEARRAEVPESAQADLDAIIVELDKMAVSQKAVRDRVLSICNAMQ